MTRTSSFIVAICLLASTSAAHSLGERATNDDLRVFHTLVDRYRSGDDGAASALAAWQPQRVARMQKDIEGLADPHPWDRNRFEAAAMLHTDAALSLMSDGAEDEGRLEGVSFHLDIAGGLLKRAASRWDMREFTSQWYAAVARVLRDRNWLTTAEQYLALGRERLPKDARVLYESATLEELFATDTHLPGHTTHARRGEGELPPQDPWSAATFEAIRRRRTFRLNRALDWVRGSLDVMPGDRLARLHAGRIQMLRNEPGDAARELGHAATSRDDAIAYLAWLFTGALHEQKHEFEQAADAYRRADGRFPGGQAAQVALSEILHRTGRGEEALAVLRKLLEGEAEARLDPWWYYFFEQPGRADERLDGIRKQVRT